MTISLYQAFLIYFLIISKSLPDLPVIFNWNKFKQSVATFLNNNRQKAKLSFCLIKSLTVKQYLGVPEYVAFHTFSASAVMEVSGRLHNLGITFSVASQ
jgi:hypothetical protein